MSALQGAVESTAPVSRLHEHRSEFPVPTGREEEWRFTPLRRLRGLHGEQPLPPGKVNVEATAAPGVIAVRAPRSDLFEADAVPVVTAVLAQRGDPRHDIAFEPSDRVSATAFASFEEATIVTVPADADAVTSDGDLRSWRRHSAARRSGTRSSSRG